MTFAEGALRADRSQYEPITGTAPASCEFKKSLRTRDLYQHVKLMSEWEQHYDQLSRGCFEGQVTEAWVGDIQIFEERISQAVFQTGIGRSDAIAVGVFAELSGEARWQGKALGLDHVTAIGQGHTLELSTPKNFAALCVSVPVSVFAPMDENLPEGGLSGALQGLRSSHVFSPKLAATLRHRLGQALMTMTYQPMQLALIEARNQLLSEVVGLVDEYVNEALAVCAETSPAKAVRVVARARDYIEAHRDSPITVLDLCKQTYTSRRTLQYCFEQVIGLSPAAYLKVLRLNGLRRDLIQQVGRTTIGDLAARWGFWHLSQFSLDYKRLFGELPSETVRRHTCH